MTTTKINTVNLYDEDGIATYLTADFDICDPTDSDAVIRVIGHAIYACSAEQADQAIRAAYLKRIKVSDPLAKEFEGM